MAERPVLYSLQYLRAVAATAVVAFHTNWTQTAIGAAGVDIFFVISGFVMALTAPRASSPRSFFRDRAIRIVPLYWLITLIHAVTDRASLQNLVLSLAFWPHTNAAGEVWPIVVPGWTLVYEMFFYGLVTASMVTPIRFRLVGLGGALMLLCVAGPVFDLGGAVWQTYTSPLLLEFMAGMLLYGAWQRGRLPPGWAGLLLLVVGVAILLAQTSWPEQRGLRPLLWGIPALLIVAGALSIEVGGRLPSLPWLHAVGSASYATYLFHGNVLHSAGRFVKPLPAPIAVTVMLVACTVAGLVVHRMVERPLTRWLKARVRRPVLAAA